MSGLLSRTGEVFLKIDKFKVMSFDKHSAEVMIMLNQSDLIE